MKIALVPTNSNAVALSGDLITDKEFRCYFLTLPRGDGLPGSAIPMGTYNVILAPSPKFQHLAETVDWFKPYADSIPHIEDIPGRSNILIHVGNTVKDTDGCILVGTTLQDNNLGGSRTAFASLMPLISEAMDTGEGCTIEML